MQKILIFGMGNWMNIIISTVKEYSPSTEVLVVGTVEFKKHQNEFDILILDDAYGYWYGCGWKMLDLLNEEQKKKTIIHTWEEKFAEKAKTKGISRRIDFRAIRYSKLHQYVLETLNLTHENID